MNPYFIVHSGLNEVFSFCNSVVYYQPWCMPCGDVKPHGYSDYVQAYERRKEWKIAQKQDKWASASRLHGKVDVIFQKTDSETEQMATVVIFVTYNVYSQLLATAS